VPDVEEEPTEETLVDPVAVYVLQDGRIMYNQRLTDLSVLALDLMQQSQSQARPLDIIVYAEESVLYGDIAAAVSKLESATGGRVMLGFSPGGANHE